MPFIFIISLLSISIPFYYTYCESLSLIKNQFNEQQIAVARQTGLGIKENIKLAVSELRRLSKNPSVTNFELNECKIIFKMKMQFFNSLYINDVGIIDSNGILRTNINEPDRVGKELSSREYFKKAKKLKKKCPDI